MLTVEEVSVHKAPTARWVTQKQQIRYGGNRIGKG